MTNYEYIESLDTYLHISIEHNFIKFTTIRKENNDSLILTIDKKEYIFNDDQLSVRFINSNLLYSEIFLSNSTKKENISYVFNNYRLNKSSLIDEDYMNSNFFAAPSRKLSGNELFFQLEQSLFLFNYDNKFLGGILTLLCYRMSESMATRKFIVDRLIKFKEEYDKKINYWDEDHLRWYVSSSSTVSTVLLMLNMLPQAEDILIKSINDTENYYSNKALGWNRSICLINLSILNYDKNPKKSFLLASLSASLCHDEINNLSSEQNPFVLYQNLDCKMMLDLLSNSIIIIKKIENKHNIKNKKYASIKIADKHTFSPKPLLKRFGCSKNDNFTKFWNEFSTKING